MGGGGEEEQHLARIRDSRGEGRSCLGMKTVKRVGTEDGVGAVEYAGDEIVMTQSNSYGEKEGGEREKVKEREREKQARISDEKLPMITDVGEVTALNDRSRFFCAICGTFTSGRGLGASEKGSCEATPSLSPRP